MTTLDEFWKDIVEETARLKAVNSNVLGCRFLYSPKETFTQNNGLLLTGMNPGGERDMSDRAYPKEDRNAYLWEDWGRWGRESPFRSRMVTFMTALFKAFDIADTEGAFNQTLTSNFLPFRSTSDSDLGEQRKQAREYGIKLWSALLPLVGVRAILCCGQKAFDGFWRVREEDANLRGIVVIGPPHASRGAWSSQEQVDHAVKLLKDANFQFS